MKNIVATLLRKWADRIENDECGVSDEVIEEFLMREIAQQNDYAHVKNDLQSLKEVVGNIYFKVKNKERHEKAVKIRFEDGTAVD